MTKEEALKKLESKSTRERLIAARYFLREPFGDETLIKLRKHLNEERVSYVRNAIALAVKRNSSIEPHFVLNNKDDQSNDKPKNDVDTWIGILLHELEPKIGLIKLAANQEIRDYDNSKIKRHIDSVDLLLEGFADLKKSRATPKSAEIDLHEFISGLVSEYQSEDLYIMLNGSQPFMVKCDPNLLGMAISNGLRNAVDAVTDNKKDKLIIISLKNSDVENTITITDNGKGLSNDVSTLFKIGNTSKINHRGFGLTIIQQAMENLNGAVFLSDSRSGGVKLELKWPRT